MVGRMTVGGREVSIYLAVGYSLWIKALSSAEHYVLR